MQQEFDKSCAVLAFLPGGCYNKLQTYPQDVDNGYVDISRGYEGI